MGVKVPGNESFIGHSFPGAKVPGSELVRVLLELSLRGANWPGSKKARYRGCYVCEPVQESSRQVAAEIWALKAQPNQPINEQVQVQDRQVAVTAKRISSHVMTN